MGKGGAALVLIMLFMAVTSTGSAEQIAVSSIFAYGMLSLFFCVGWDVSGMAEDDLEHCFADVYREYFNKNATGKDVCTFALVT